MKPVRPVESAHCAEKDDIVTEQPNILFIQVDQLTALALRAYGDRICHAPTLDALAENGVVFENAYCNFPLCAPSRFSMASGQLCSRIGAYDNASEFSAEIPTYAHYLRTAGYQTALSGKMHFIGPDQFHGFERRLTAELYPSDFSWVPCWGNEGKRDTNDSRAVRIAGICERSVQIDFDEEVTYKAVQHIYGHGPFGRRSTIPAAGLLYASARALSLPEGILGSL